MIRFACPHCEKGFQVDDKFAGRPTKCPGCARPISVPALTTPPTIRPRTSSRESSSATPNQPVSISRSADDDGDSRGLSTLAKALLGVGVVVSVSAISFLVWFVAFRDTWEVYNAYRLTERIEEADRLHTTDPLSAFKIYDEVIQESQGHEIADISFAKRLTAAQDSRHALKQIVQNKLDAEEAERRRQEAEEAHRIAMEARRIADAKAKQQADEDARKAAEAKRLADDQRRKEAVAIYHNAPPSARSALNAIKKVQARTEVGLNYRDYSNVVGEAWAEVKVFVESPDGKSLPEFSELLVAAMGKYKLALDLWQGKLDSDLTYDKPLSDILMQQCWRSAGARQKAAETLLSKDDTAVLSTLAKLERFGQADAEYESAMRKTMPQLVIVQLARKTLGLEPNRTSSQDNLKKHIATVDATIKPILLQEDAMFPIAQ